LHVRLSLIEITSLFGLSRYLDRTFAQRIGSAKVKSKSEVAHCLLRCVKMYVASDDMCQNGAGVNVSPKLCLNRRRSFIVQSLTAQLMRRRGHVNLSSFASCMPRSPSRCFSSQSSDDDDDDDDDDDATDSAAGADYYERYKKLVTQSQPLGTLSPLSSVSADRTAAATLSHVDDSGTLKMVDVGSKSVTSRLAVAAGRVRLGGSAFQQVAENRLKKGSVLTAAQLAGVLAAKQTGRLIPLCHGVSLTSVDVTLTLDAASLSVVVECTVRARGQTGVEMEALTGVAVAALTVYDMCKSVSHDILITDIRLVAKTGGKSDFHRQ